MQKMLNVIALAGTQCPMENAPRKYITDKEPVKVPRTSFYLRLIRDGSLIDVKTSGSKLHTSGGSKKTTATEKKK